MKWGFLWNKLAIGVEGGAKFGLAVFRDVLRELDVELDDETTAGRGLLVSAVDLGNTVREVEFKWQRHAFISQDFASCGTDDFVEGQGENTVVERGLGNTYEFQRSR